MNSRIATAVLRAVSLHLLILPLGCQQLPPTSDLPNRISAVTGVHDPIHFAVSGEPTDVISPASAANSDAEVLPLSRAVDAALHHDPQVQASVARVRAALADAEQARLLPNPVLSVVVRLPESGTGQPVIEAGLAADLISLLRKPREASAADNRLRAATAEALKTAIDLVAEVQERYSTVQALDAETVVLNERRDIIKRLLELADARLRAGESARLDVITLEAQRAELEADMIEHDAERIDQRLTLARLMGTPSATADWKLTPWQAPVMAGGNERQWIAVALRHRPEVQAQVWELAALGDEAALANFAVFDGAEVGVDAERDGTWTVGPGVSTPLPLFDWGQARRKKIEAQQAEARHALTRVRRQVVEEVRRALAASAATTAAMNKVRSELVPAQERRREHAEAAYRNGLADITTVLLAEQDLQASRSKLIELEKKNSLAVSRLHRAVGGSGVAASVENSLPASQPSSSPASQPLQNH